MEFDNEQSARHFLDRLNFEKYLVLEWEIETWAKNGLQVNLSLADKKSTLKVYDPAQNAGPFMLLLKNYCGRVEQLTEPLVQYMYNETVAVE